MKLQSAMASQGVLLSSCGSIHRNESRTSDASAMTNMSQASSEQ